jgi:hypothetical protein
MRPLPRRIIAASLLALLVACSAGTWYLFKAIFGS